MLEKARQVLSDFTHAVNLLDEAEDEQTIRVLCVAAASLNRSVGWALQNDENEEAASCSKDLYRQWKSDAGCIFNTFITKYRNRVLHDNENDLETNAPLGLICDGELIEVFDIPFIYIPFSCEDYGDADVRDMFHESIDWWKEQLNRVEERVLGFNR